MSQSHLLAGGLLRRNAVVQLIDESQVAMQVIMKIGDCQQGKVIYKIVLLVDQSGISEHLIFSGSSKQKNKGSFQVTL